MNILSKKKCLAVMIIFVFSFNFSLNTYAASLDPDFNVTEVYTSPTPPSTGTGTAVAVDSSGQPAVVWAGDDGGISFRQASSRSGWGSIEPYFQTVSSISNPGIIAVGANLYIYTVDNDNNKISEYDITNRIEKTIYTAGANESIIDVAYNYNITNNERNAAYVIHDSNTDEYTTRINNGRTETVLSTSSIDTKSVSVSSANNVDYVTSIEDNIIKLSSTDGTYSDYAAVTVDIDTNIVNAKIRTSDDGNVLIGYTSIDSNYAYIKYTHGTGFLLTEEMLDLIPIAELEPSTVPLTHNFTTSDEAELYYITNNSARTEASVTKVVFIPDDTTRRSIKKVWEVTGNDIWIGNITNEYKNNIYGYTDNIVWEYSTGGGNNGYYILYATQPEPSSLVLMILGFLSLLGMAWRKRFFK